MKKITAGTKWLIMIALVTIVHTGGITHGGASDLVSPTGEVSRALQDGRVPPGNGAGIKGLRTDVAAARDRHGPPLAGEGNMTMAPLEAPDDFIGPATGGDGVSGFPFGDVAAVMRTVNVVIPDVYGLIRYADAREEAPNIVPEQTSRGTPSGLADMGGPASLFLLGLGMSLMFVWGVWRKSGERAGQDRHGGQRPLHR